MDALALFDQAIELLPDGARAENGVTVEDVRDYQHHTEWELAFGVLEEIGDAYPLPPLFWDLLREVAVTWQLVSERKWCEWRAWEARNGTIRADLLLLGAEEGGRRTAVPTGGVLRPMWDIGGREWQIAKLWVEYMPKLEPGESTSVRLAPIWPEHWRHLRVGDVIMMHEAVPAIGTAVIIELSPPTG
ncbi:hypothetical protein [Amycolatopsis sp. NPDC059657]|uniref:hypothetical protein n=1 Tax=Amycolatopsis sp. NPDC059657 TaxID=3346899 RepID=UPI003672C5AC